MAFMNTSINDSSAFEPTLMIKWHSHSVNNQIGQLPRQTLSLFHHFVHNFLKTKKKLEDHILHFKMCQNFKNSFCFLSFRPKISLKINCPSFLLNVRDYLPCHFGGALIDTVQPLIELFLRVHRHLYRVRHGARENLEHVGLVWPTSAI